MNNINIETSNYVFPVTVYGQLEKFNDTISKGRCRIFYKGANRNGTYITDEFAEKLISTIAYAPVKGIYDPEGKDFTDHGTNNAEGRIYGVVPGEYNFAWEKHLDEDGIEREYACVDVLIYTALYPEANQIEGCAQSMELYRPSIKGSRQAIDGKIYFVFTDGAFFGLQVLGESVEPCFEGAAFFSLYQSLMDQVAQLEKSNISQQDGQGGNTMHTASFQLSFEQTESMLWRALNPNCDEEHNYEVTYSPVATYPEYVVVMCLADNKFYRAYYTKNEDETVSIDNLVECFMIDVTEGEKNALEALRRMNGDTYTAIDEKFGDYDELSQKIEEYSSKITELSDTISTLTIERDNISNKFTNEQQKNVELADKFAAIEATLAGITAERDTLIAYRKDVEHNARVAVIGNYANSLSNETIEHYQEICDSYTLEELDMKLTYEQKKAHPELFGGATQSQYVLTEEPHMSGIEEILSRYEKKHN